MPGIVGATEILGHSFGQAKAKGSFVPGEYNFLSDMVGKFPAKNLRHGFCYLQCAWHRVIIAHFRAPDPTAHLNCDHSRWSDLNLSRRRQLEMEFVFRPPYGLALPDRDLNLARRPEFAGYVAECPIGDDACIQHGRPKRLPFQACGIVTKALQ